MASSAVVKLNVTPTPVPVRLGCPPSPRTAEATQLLPLARPDDHGRRDGGSRRAARSPRDHREGHASGQEQTRLTLDRAWIVGQAGTDRVEPFGSIAFRPVVANYPIPYGRPNLAIRCPSASSTTAGTCSRRASGSTSCEPALPRPRLGQHGQRHARRGRGRPHPARRRPRPARPGGAPAVGRRRPGVASTRSSCRTSTRTTRRAPLVLAQVGRAHLRQPRDVRGDGPRRRDDRGLRRARARRGRAVGALTVRGIRFPTTRRAPTRSWSRTAARRWATRPTSATSDRAARRVPRLRRRARRVEPRPGPAAPQRLPVVAEGAHPRPARPRLEPGGRALPRARPGRRLPHAGARAPVADEQPSGARRRATTSTRCAAAAARRCSLHHERGRHRLDRGRATASSRAARRREAAPPVLP